MAPRPEVGQRLRVLAGQVDPGRVERLERGHPVRDRGRERLAEERAERDVLPGLDVARRPVVEPDDAEDVVGERVVRRPACRASDGGADHEAELGLDVEPGARAERRAASAAPCAGRCGRTTGVPDDDDGAGAAVVADREVLPVGQQRLAVGAEDPADVGGVVLARRRSRRSRRPRPAGAASPRRAARRCGSTRSRSVASVEQAGDPARARDSRTWRPSAISGLSERLLRRRGATSSIVGGRDRRQVEHEVADPHADPRRPRPPRRTRRTAGCRRRTSDPAAPSTQVVVDGHAPPAGPRASRSSSGSLTEQEPNEVNQRRAPARSSVARGLRPGRRRSRCSSSVDAPRRARRRRRRAGSRPAR